jgi:protein O-mannosyl-transferase
VSKSKGIFLIILLGFIVFGNGLRNGFVGDDLPQIVENASIYSIANVGTFFSGSTFFNGNLQKMTGVYYKPLLMTLFSVVYSLFGPNAFWFHLIQLVIHISGTIILFLVLKRFFDERWSLILSIIFLVHPFNSEAVFYISATQDVLFFFFGILGLWLYIKLNSKYSTILLSICLFASILSKESGILFFGVSLLFSYLYNKKYLVSTLVGEIVIFGIYLWLRVNALGSLVAKSNPIAPVEKLDLMGRLINIPEIIWFYINTFVFPFKLSYSYNWIQKTITFNHFWIPLVMVSIFFVLCIYFGFQLKKFTKLDYFFNYLFFCAWFVFGILLHIQIIPLDVTVAERWFYFPMIGLLGMMAVIINMLNFKLNRYMYMIAGVVLLLLCFRTIVRSFDYKNEYIINSHDIKVSTDDYNLENGLAVDLLKLGLIDDAKYHVEKSIEYNPYWSNYNTLGSILLSQGDFEKAKEAYTKALSYTEYYQIYENLAGITLATGNYHDNVSLIISYINKFPEHAKLWLYIAILQYTHGDIDEAKIAISKAVKYNLTNNQEIVTINDIITNNKPLLLNLRVGSKDINKK